MANPKKEFEKAAMGAEALASFFNQFGDDVHAKLLLEILLEGVVNEETLFVSGEPQQTGDQTNHGASGRIDGNVSPERSEHP